MTSAPDNSASARPDMAMRWYLVGLLAELLLLTSFIPACAARHFRGWIAMSVCGAVYVLTMWPMLWRLYMLKLKALSPGCCGSRATWRMVKLAGLTTLYRLAWGMILATACIDLALWMLSRGRIFPLTWVDAIIYPWVFLNFALRLGGDPDLAEDRQTVYPMEDPPAELAGKFGCPNVQFFWTDRDWPPARYRLFSYPAVALSRTLRQRLSGPQIQSVVAHELAHHRLTHSKWTILLNCAQAALAVAVACATVAALARFNRAAVLREPLLSSALGLMASWLTFFALRPFAVWVLHRQERQANALALEMTNDPAAFIEAMTALTPAGAADAPPPPLWKKVFLQTHPTLPEVIEQTRRYAAERDMPL